MPKKIVKKIFEFIAAVNEHNIFLHASSIAYYATLALAPLILVLLGLAALVGPDAQAKVLDQMAMLVPELEGIFSQILKNLNEELKFSSIPGIIASCVTIFLASNVFQKLRYSFDAIDEYRPESQDMSISAWVVERGFFMIVVLVMCALFVLSLVIGPVLSILMPAAENVILLKISKTILTFCILYILFFALYVFTPSRKKRLKECAKIALFTSIFFQIGNFLIGLYMKTVAIDSLYGAAGSLLIFLLWTYYSVVTVLLGAEIFEFMKKRKPLV